MMYEVTALFDHAVAGQMSRAASETPDGCTYGPTPESAARKLLWRLSAEEREATSRLIVSAVPKAGYRPYPIYSGPELLFVRVGARLDQVIEADA
jgi:hypothetical protein